MLYNMFMDMFVALSDPTRRAILEILASSGELSATAIYEHFSVSPQAISQHLKALREAKYVEQHPHRLENTMGKVLFGLSVSLDGFIADKNDGVSEVFAWMGSAMEHFFEVAGEQLNETGAVIMGHRSFDQIYSEQGWVMPDGTPIPGPVIVSQ